MKRFLGLSAALVLALYPVAASALEARTLQISREGDLEMDCAALSREALLMRDIIFITQDIKDESKMQSTGIDVAGTAASFLVGTATGGIGIAAAGYLASQMTDEKNNSADDVQDIAEQRRSFMVGVYNAKGCYGPIENVLKSPAPTPSLLERLTDIESAAGDEDPAKKRYNP